MKIVDSDDLSVTAHPILLNYKQLQQKSQRINIRKGKLSDIIEEIGNLHWKETKQRFPPYME